MKRLRLLFLLAACSGGVTVAQQPGPGLWIGTVELHQVIEAQAGSNPVTRVSHAVGFRMLIHVDTNATARLLKQATLMKTPGSNAVPVLVLNDARMPEFEGLVRKGRRLVGQRVGSVGYDFEGLSLELTGVPAPGASVKGTIVLPAQHATNPFFHRYHNRLQTGREIRRILQIDFAPPENHEDPNRLHGTYQETLTGLHKVPLVVKGRIRLQRAGEVYELAE